MNRRILAAMAATVVLLAGLVPGAVYGRDPDSAARPLPASIESLKLDRRVTSAALKDRVHRELESAGGNRRVLVRLKAAPSSTAASRGGPAEVAQLRRVEAQQDDFVGTVKRLDRRARILGQTQRATNIVALQVDVDRLDELARDPNVVSIHPVVDYEKTLPDTVPYIGATAVQARGFDGKGVRVGVIDSGIDYTHVAFGGAGTTEAYEAAYGTSTEDTRNVTLDGLFPTAKVAGGFDFVGESWPLDDPIEDPDPDPIDFEGHGTHVADIIAGTQGVAPKARLYSLKVCSAVDVTCSGVGLIQAMDWVVDPNGDGRTTDHLDIVNVSIGSDYGDAFNDDLALAVDQASRLGVLTVASAGNGGDLPYIAGTPANTKTALSVAETNVPSAVAFPLVVDAPPSIAGAYPNTATNAWAPIGDGFSGAVAYVGRGCPADSIEDGSPEDPYLSDPSGKVALIDRGDCDVSLKTDRAAKAGAVAVLIGLIGPGDPQGFSLGGGDTFVPTIVIEQGLSEAIKAEIEDGETVEVSVSDAVSVPLVGSMAGSSSRGPSSPYNMIKPEIGAPGASVSALVGSGTGTEPFSGTSGAAPMVAGAAALLRQAFPDRSIAELKALIMNTGETRILNNAANRPGYLAPISRIGGGELRVDRALRSPIAAWDKADHRGVLSFRLRDITKKTTTIEKVVAVHNYSSRRRTYTIKAAFRYTNDASNGAVKVSVPDRITIAAGRSATFTVRMTINGAKLRDWTLDAGPNATNPDALDLLEYDGYIWFNDPTTASDNDRRVHLAWHVLPRLSGSISAPTSVAIDSIIEGGPYADLPAGTATLRNSGVGVGAVDTFSLVGTSPDLPEARRGTNAPIIDLKSVGVQTFPVPADFCSPDESFIFAFAINTWERHSTIGAIPGQYEVLLDTDQDGTADYVVFTAPLAGAADISWLTWSLDLGDPTAVPEAFFFADNGTNDANVVMPICGEQIGMNATNFFQPMDMAVGAFDNAFTLNLTDTIEDITVAPLGERFLGIFDEEGSVNGDVPANGSAELTVVDFGEVGTNPGETGLLLVNNAFRTGADGDFHGGAPAGKEATRILVEP